MFAGMFALFVFTVAVLALAGVAVMFAFAVFELLAVVQPAQKTANGSKSKSARVRRI
jgi:hypothetical protein